jgi:molybdopterin-guanine dinucleotide biosynthesis protein A
MRSKPEAEARVFFGAVLAGGESRRMGRDKARLRVAGEPLWRRQVWVLRVAGAEPVALVRREGQKILDKRIPHLRDALTGAGPLAGLHAALQAAESPWVAVLAVDMPAIDAEWFRRLLAQCRRGTGAVAKHADGYEPLAAIYPRNALAIVARRLQRGERSMQGLVRALARAKKMMVVPLPEEKRRRVENWNRPEDRRKIGKVSR